MAISHLRISGRFHAIYRFLSLLVSEAEEIQEPIEGKIMTELLVDIIYVFGRDLRNPKR